jgi:hypothetical protein
MSTAEVLALYRRYGIDGTEGGPEGTGTAPQGGLATVAGAQNAPRVPKAETAVVWRLHPDNTLEPVQVSLGITDHAFTEVNAVLKGQLKEGDEVVIRSVVNKTSALGSLRR